MKYQFEIWNLSDLQLELRHGCMFEKDDLTASIYFRRFSVNYFGQLKEADLGKGLIMTKYARGVGQEPPGPGSVFETARILSVGGVLIDRVRHRRLMRQAGLRKGIGLLVPFVRRPRSR